MYSELNQLLERADKALTVLGVNAADAMRVLAGLVDRSETLAERFQLALIPADREAHVLEAHVLAGLIGAIALAVPAPAPAAAPIVAPSAMPTPAPTPAPSPDPVPMPAAPADAFVPATAPEAPL